MVEFLRFQLNSRTVEVWAIRCLARLKVAQSIANRRFVLGFATQGRFVNPAAARLTPRERFDMVAVKSVNSATLRNRRSWSIARKAVINLQFRRSPPTGENRP